MILAQYDGEQWKTYNTEGAGRVSCSGEVYSLIGRLITNYGLVVDKEHPLSFNLGHYAWTMEQKKKGRGEPVRG